MKDERSRTKWDDFLDNLSTVFVLFMIGYAIVTAYYWVISL